MAAEKIGPARCPLCAGTASVSLSKARLPVLTCNACNCQLFTRSDRSDSLVRELLHKPGSTPPPAAPVPAAAPTAAAPAPSSDPEPTPAPRRSGWLSGLNAILD